MLIGALSGLTGAALIAVISQVFTNGADLAKADLIKHAVLLTGLVLFSLVVDLFAKWYLLKYIASRHRDLHVNFSRIVLNDSLRHSEQIGMARLITIYTEDMSLIGVALNLLASVGISFFVILGCLVYLATISISVLGITLLVGLIAAMGYSKIHRESIRLAKESLEFRDQHISQFKDLVQGIGELKLNYRKRQQYIDQEYIPAVYGHERTYVKSMLAHLLANSWTQLIFFALMISILVFFVASSIDPVIMGPFLIVALFMRTHIVGLIAAVPIWSRAGVTLERIYKQGYTDLHRPRVLTKTEPLPKSKEGGLTIKVENLTWRYTSEVDESTFTVGPLSVSMHSGEIIFLVGSNGSGKSTFAKLLAGLYVNESGRLLYNDLVIDNSNRSSYNELFSMLFSDPFIFERLTLPEDESYPDEQQEPSDTTNVAACKSNESSDKRIAYYLEKLQLHHKVSVDNQRLSSTNLSTGQRKRLALLAAYLEDKPIMIFDEWAENQDPAFKNVFYNELLQELKSRGKLVLVISHEAQFYGVADRVITLDASDVKATQVTAKLVD